MQLVHKPSESNQTESESTLSADFSLEDRSGSCKLADTDMDSPGIGAISVQNPDAEERYPCGTMSSHEDCSTSGIYQHKAYKIMQRNKSRGTTERNKCKRWRGRHEVQDSFPELLDQGCKQELKAAPPVNVNISEEQQVSEISSAVDAGGNKEDKYEIMLALKELSSKGMDAEVVEQL